MESEPQSSYPGKILDLALHEKIITESEKNEIWSDNVLQWLFGEDEAEKEKLVKKIIS
jgi:aminocarboxymuconate-semialdehyde decarboxylase